MTQFNQIRCCNYQRISLFFIFVFLLWPVQEVSSKISIINKEVLQNYKFATLNGIYTEHCLDCKIENWSIKIDTILSAQSPSNKNQGEYCTINIKHAPPKSEVLVYQNPQNAGKDVVALNDEIRYVSMKMPFEIQIFKGELENCQSYSDAPNLQELIKRLNDALSPNQQKTFLAQSYSNILLRTFIFQNTLDEVLTANFNNLDVVGDFLMWKAGEFKQEKAAKVYEKLVELLMEIVAQQVKEVVNQVSSFHMNNQEKLAQIENLMNQKIAEQEAALKEALIKIDNGQIMKRVVLNSEEVINEFLSQEIFKKKRTIFLNGEAFQPPTSYFPEILEVDFNSFIETYVPTIVRMFDEQVNLNVKLPPRLKMAIDNFVSQVNVIFNTQLVSAKIDMFELGNIENQFKKKIQMFVSSDIPFKTLFSTVIKDEIQARLGGYMRSWFESENVRKLNLLNEGEMVKLELLDQVYHLFGSKPFSKLPQKHHLIRFLEFEEDLRLI